MLIIGKRILRLRNADGEISEAKLFKIGQCLSGCRSILHSVRTVDFSRNGLNFTRKGLLQLIQRMILSGLLLYGRKNLFRKCLSAGSAVCPDRCQGKLTVMLLAEVLDHLMLCFGVRNKGVDRNHCGYAELLQVFDVLAKIDKSLPQCLQILRLELCLRHTAVVFQCLYRCDNDCGIRCKTCCPALDIQEFLCSEVSAKACLRHNNVTKLQSCSGCANRVAAMRNVCKGTTVNQNRRMLQSLHQIRLHRVL